MPRAFTPADRVQVNSGTDVLTVNPTLALPSGVVEGNGGIIVMQAGTNIDAPEHWDMVIDETVVAIMCRADLPAGETTWPFTAGGTAANWEWQVEEWANLSFTPIAADPFTAGLVAGPSSLTMGPSGTTDAPYVMCIAVVSLFQGGAGAVWPSVSWSGGFTETDVLSIGDGSATGDMQIRVARYYGTLNETGPWSTTATFTGTMTTKTGRGLLAVFRAQEDIEVPGPVVLSTT